MELPDILLWTLGAIPLFVLAPVFIWGIVVSRRNLPGAPGRHGGWQFAVSLVIFASVLAMTVPTTIRLGTTYAMQWLLEPIRGLEDPNSPTILEDVLKDLLATGEISDDAILKATTNIISVLATQALDRVKLALALLALLPGAAALVASVVQGMRRRADRCRYFISPTWHRGRVLSWQLMAGGWFGLAAISSLHNAPAWYSEERLRPAEYPIYMEILGSCRKGLTWAFAALIAIFTWGWLLVTGLAVFLVIWVTRELDASELVGSEIDASAAARTEASISMAVTSLELQREAINAVIAAVAFAISLLALVISLKPRPSQTTMAIYTERSQYVEVGDVRGSGGQWWVDVIRVGGRKPFPSRVWLPLTQLREPDHIRL